MSSGRRLASSPYPAPERLYCRSSEPFQSAILKHGTSRRDCQIDPGKDRIGQAGHHVQVLEYPPIYVVGDVTTPGQYKFSSGLTVLQALALAGGELRANKNSNSKDEIQLVGDLRANEIETLRGMARIARLQAEMTGTGDIHFPLVPPGTNSDLAAEVFAQERIILGARANEIARQTKSYPIA
jgi:hypothetical protein